MTGPNDPPFNANEAIRLRLLGRAKALNASVLSRFRTAAEDLEGECHLRALGALDGVDTEIAKLRTLLRLFDE